ncbi:MAG: NEL-type E3 ubiquitin ligase domain-containing protein [Candidatus Rhabdochlamydia sp.]
MHIINLHASPASFSYLDQECSYKILLAEELNHLTPQDILPNQIVIQGSVKISPDHLASFDLLNAKDVHILGDLDLFNCHTLTALPKHLKIEGSLDLSKCEALMHLPDDLEVKGHLNLSYCKALTALPSRLKVGKSLNVSRCENLTKLPDNFEITDYFILSDCKRLTTLSSHLKVGHSLILNNCESLTHLCKNLEVKKDLILTECSALVTLPSGIKVGGDLDLSFCDSLTHLSEDLEVKEDLILLCCRKLATISSKIKVGGRLNLASCQSLAYLSDDLDVKGDLNLSRCTALTALPNSIKLGGNLNLSGCSSLMSLPDWIVTLGLRSNGLTRSINLTRTGALASAFTRLQEQAQNLEGVQFHFSQAAPKEYVIQFETLLSALQFWQKAANASFDLKTVCQNLDEKLILIQDRKNLLQFLIRLTGSADYCNGATRAHLATRVLQAVHLMIRDQETCCQFAYLIHQGLASCDDRVITTLDTLGFYQQLHGLRHPSVTAEELKQAGKKFFLLESLNKQIELYTKKLLFIDEVEVYMAFHIRLQPLLNLPIETEGMIFRKYVSISDQEIDEVGRGVLQKMTEDSLDSFLLNWDPWQRYQRRLFFPKWEELPLADRILSSEDLCPYRLDSPDQGIVYRNVVYDYDAFKQRYIETGSDLNRERVQIDELFRLKR